MKTKVKVIIISAAIAVGLIACGAAVVINGVFTYVSRCAHIEPNENVSAEVGSTLTIDELGKFTNYDTRKITWIENATGDISQDGQSITITGGDGPASIYVFATNSRAPEHTEKTVKVIIKGEG